MGFQDDVIDAPGGEEPMPVTAVASMPHGLATHLSAMVKVRQEVAGFAAVSASWSSGLMHSGLAQT